jgi:hypothetical protein
MYLRRKSCRMSSRVVSGPLHLEPASEAIS